MSQSTVKNDGTEEKLIDFPDFEGFLKKCFGENIQISNYKVVDFLPFGENFCSVVGRVEAWIRKNDESNEEKLQLIAKMAGDISKYDFGLAKAFKKEVFFYNTIIPIYNEFEMEMGVEKEAIFNNVPKFYGYRYSLNSEIDEIDNNCVILMEDLSATNNYMGNRKVGKQLF